MRTAASESFCAPMTLKQDQAQALRAARSREPFRNYDYLMITDEEGNNVLNENSMEVVTAYAEPSILEAAPGERFQFFRHGYYIADEKLTTDTEKVFNRIVDLKSSYKPGK